jgi:hypothetical protein
MFASLLRHQMTVSNTQCKTILRDAAKPLLLNGLLSCMAGFTWCLDLEACSACTASEGEGAGICNRTRTHHLRWKGQATGQALERMNPCRGAKPLSWQKSDLDTAALYRAPGASNFLGLLKHRSR